MTSRFRARGRSSPCLPDPGRLPVAAPWRLAWTGSLLVGLALVAGARPAAAQDSPGGGGSGFKASQGGEQIYRQICQACHMPDARGSTGAAQTPALARNPKLADASYPITMVLKGRGSMPWFAGTLTPAQIAAVVGYVRTHFGNDYAAPVSVADVLALSVDLPVTSE